MMWIRIYVIVSYCDVELSFADSQTLDLEPPITEAIPPSLLSAMGLLRNTRHKETALLNLCLEGQEHQ